MKKKILISLLTAALTIGSLGAFAGCGQAESSAVWQETGDSAADESAAGDSAAAGASEAESDSSMAETDNASETEDAVENTDSQDETEVAADSQPAAQPHAADARINDCKVKGIYVTGAMAGTANMDNLIDLVDRTELNTLVIDVKNDEGRVVYEMNTPVVSEIGAVKRYVKDMPALVAKCKEKNIYLIARIVAFKDPYLAEAKPEWSLHNADGSIFRDRSGQAWVNPYERNIWDYLVEVALGAAETGFDEIQFDYIRFSTDRGMKQVDFGPEAADKSKTDVVAEFTAYAAEALHEKGVAVSADVYGVVIDSEIDQQIVGQDYLKMAESLDALSPMVYPSHYGPFNYGIPIPDAQPYETVLASMQASKKVLAGMQPKAGVDMEPEDSVSGNDLSGNSVSGNGIPAEPLLSTEEIAALTPIPTVRATVRPWLQDFTATWVKGHIKYGPQQLRDQIQAVYDAGYEEWILWNAANRYTEGGLLQDADISRNEAAPQEGVSDNDAQEENQ